jgi:hypothetical protein
VELYLPCPIRLHGVVLIEAQGQFYLHAYIIIYVYSMQTRLNMLMLVIFKHVYDESYSSQELQYCEGWALVKIQVGLPDN